VLTGDIAVQQTAWKELDKGRARRTFDYSATFLDILGRNRRAEIVDHQTIERQDDHLWVLLFIPTDTS
jgi:hypothetical protein